MAVYIPILSAVLQFQQKSTKQKELVSDTIEGHVKAIKQLKAELIVINKFLDGSTVQLIVAVAGLIFATAFKVLTLTSTILLVVVTVSLAIQNFRNWYLAKQNRLSIVEEEKKCILALLSEIDREPQAKDISEKIKPLFEKDFHLITKEQREARIQFTDHLKTFKENFMEGRKNLDFFNSLTNMEVHFTRFTLTLNERVFTHLYNKTPEEQFKSLQETLKQPSFNKCLFLAAKLSVLSTEITIGLGECLKKHLGVFWTDSDTKELESVRIY